MSNPYRINNLERNTIMKNFTPINYSWHDLGTVCLSVLKGNYGTGLHRKQRLERWGWDWTIVQGIVELLYIDHDLLLEVRSDPTSIKGILSCHMPTMYRTILAGPYLVDQNKFTDLKNSELGPIAMQQFTAQETISPEDARDYAKIKEAIQQYLDKYTFSTKRTDNLDRRFIIRNIAIGAEKVDGVRVYDISVTQQPIAPNEDIIEHEIRMNHWLEVTAWSSQRPNSTVVRHIG